MWAAVIDPAIAYLLDGVADNAYAAVLRESLLANFTVKLDASMMIYCT